MARDWLRRARSLDGHPALVSATRSARRLLPGDPGFGDPLSTAGRDSAGTVARLADRLYDGESRASRELGLGVLQVWQTVLVRTGRGRGDRELTVVFTDLVDFSDWALRAGDDAALDLLRQVSRALEKPVTARRGTVVKRLGDGLMAVFPTAQLAFDAVHEGAERLAQVHVDGYRPRLRAGLHSGRPRGIGGDYVGVDVNVAARLVDRAAPGEVLVSDTALAGLDPERVDAKRKRSFTWVRTKGVPGDLTAYVATPRRQPTEL